MFLHVLHDDTLYLLVYALAYKTLSSTAFWSKLKRSAIVLSLSGRLFILRKYIQHRTQINFLTRMLAWSAVVHASYILKRWNLIPLMYVMLCRRHDNWVDSADNITLKTLYSFRVRGGGDTQKQHIHEILCPYKREWIRSAVNSQNDDSIGPHAIKTMLIKDTMCSLCR